MSDPYYSGQPYYGPQYPGQIPMEYNPGYGSVNSYQLYPGRTNKIFMWVFLGVGAVVLVVAIVIVIIIMKPKSSSSSRRPITSSSAASGPTGGTIPVGGNCDAVNDCVPGAFCAEDGICYNGAGSVAGDNCVNLRTCLWGTYCNGDFQCANGTGGVDGQPCDTTAECEVGYKCSAQVCSETSSSAPPPTCSSKIAVYRTMQVSTFRLTDRVDPPGGSTYYPSPSPIWYGCNSGNIGLYQWIGNSTGDRVWSSSNVKPFAIGTTYGGQTYSLVSTTPLTYVFSSPATGLLPIYRLEANNLDNNQWYHTTQLNGTSINNPTYPQTVYAVDQNMYPTGLGGTPGLIGYGFLSP